MLLNRAYELLLLTVICTAQSAYAADNFSYDSLVGDTPKQLPYGEPEAITGESANFKVGDLQLDSWINIEKIMLDYQVSGGAAKTEEVTLSKSGTWNVLLDPLPSASKISLLFRFEGKITDTKSSSLTNVLFPGLHD